MKKGWIVALVILLVLIGAVSLLMLSIGSLMESEPSLGNKTVLVLELTGELPESAPADFVTRILEQQALTFPDTLKAIEKAGTDKRITGIWLKIDSPAIGWAKVRELQDKLADFKKSGKFIVATAEMMNERDYACALPADAIYMPEEGYLEYDGFVATATFLKDMFNKFGIEPEVENFGKYKSFGDMLKRNSMSDEQREVMNAMLDQVVSDFTAGVSRFRKVTAERALALLDEGLHRPDQAVAERLLDGTLYEDQVEELLKEKNGEKGKKTLTTITGKKYRRVSVDSEDNEGTDQIAVIRAVGSIIRGVDTNNPVFGRNMGSDTLIKSIRKARENKNVKALILRVDSPGGDGLASDLMWRELRLTDKEKPVIASMSDVAASGGYFIAMGCRKIVAEPGTITGSIGVVSAKFNLKGMYDWLGLRFETLKRGKWADEMSDTRAMTPEERERFRARTYRFYETFVTKAAQSRHKKYEELDAVAQGRVWMGSQAIGIGLVDSLGGMDRAVELARESAGIPKTGKIRLVEYPEPRKLMDQILESIAETRLETLDPTLRKTLRYLSGFAMPGPGAPLAMMPYLIEIH